MESSSTQGRVPGIPFQKPEQQCCLRVVQTHHESVVGEAVAALDVLHEVSAAVAGVSPGHRGAYGADLLGGSTVLHSGPEQAQPSITSAQPLPDRTALLTSPGTGVVTLLHKLEATQKKLVYLIQMTCENGRVLV